MDALKNKNLAFFLTCGLSLEKWDRLGMLSREIALYNQLAESFRKIYLFTYASQKELFYQKYLAPNIQIIPKKATFLPNFFYSFLIPFFHYSTLHQCHFFKSNQMFGAWSAYLSKLFTHPTGYFILRTGFTWSLFLKKEKRWSLSIIKPFVSFLEKFLYHHSDIAFVSSRYDQKYIENQYQANPVLIRNYVDTNLFQPQKNAPKLKKRILYIGRLHPQKNLFNLVKAVQGTNLTLDLVGQGPLKNKLSVYAKKSNVPVNFKNLIPNAKLPSLINQYSIFVLPSFYEGMPKTLLEAMACGIACVATKVQGSKEVIQNYDNGLLTNTDFHSLREGILKVWNDRKLRKKLGINARLTILKKYSLQSNVTKELKIYASLF